MSNNPKNPTFEETIKFLRANPEYQASIIEYFDHGMRASLSKIAEQGEQYPDLKRVCIAGIYAQLQEAFR